MSAVTRVTSRPTGFRSKNAIGSRSQMREHLEPQVTHHPLAEQARKDRLAVGAGELDDQREDEQQDRAADGPMSWYGTRDVDHALREERTDELQRAFREEAPDRSRDERPVRTDVRREPPNSRPSYALPSASSS